MKKRYLAVVVLLLAGCSSVPTKDIQFDAEADPKANFSGYKTYAWLGSAAVLSDPFGQWESPAFDADAEVKYLIDREMRKRGMSENSRKPDVIVAFAVGIDMETLGLKVDPETKIETLANVPRGGFVIALYDRKTGFVIWAGIATGDIQEQLDSKAVRARLDYAVTRLMRMVPK
jgi:hypothetical protein